jgi:hypothetical protein
MASPGKQIAVSEEPLDEDGVGMTLPVEKVSGDEDVDEQVLDLEQALASALMSWGIDKDIDEVCEKKLGLRRLSRNVTFGLRG